MQTKDPGLSTTVLAHQFSERSLTVHTGAFTLLCTVLSEHLLRIRYAPSGKFQPRRSWAVARADEEYAAVTVQKQETSQQLEIGSRLVQARIDRADGRLAFVRPDGAAFFADALPPSMLKPELTKSSAAEDHFYGFGERTGLLEKTGRRMVNWATDPAHSHGSGVDPLYMAIPVVFGLTEGQAFGLYFNNTFRSEFDLTQPGKFVFKADGGELDYYLAYGPTPADVLEALTGLLGRMPLPPLWSLGYHQSRWSYSPQQEVLKLAAEFRERNIPCDCIHLDIDHMEGFRDFTWNAKTFSDPAGLCSDLREQGFHIVPILDAGVKIDLNYSAYQRGLEWDAFIRLPDGRLAHGFVWPDDSVFFDFLRPKARELWGSLVRGQVDLGIEGIWNDMNEPVVFDKPFSQGGGGAGTLPLEALQGGAGERVTHAEAHNLYGSGMAQATYEGLKKHLTGRRPFVLTRSAFAGVQRWSAGWMGDNDSWWEHLELSLPQLMNMGLSGVPFVGVDIGGFGNNASPELFARWIEIGALYPFCRGHSSIHTRQQEPWAFGAQVEAISRKYLTLRYRLLPYLYTLFWEAAQIGAPVWRPLFYHFPQDALTYDLHDQVMIGPHLLAAPVYQPGRINRTVYLPAGKWYDYWTDQVYEGPCHLLAPAPMDRLPLFVRAGAVLPLGSEKQYTSQQASPDLTLELYPGTGEFIVYEDDGQTFAYENGMSCLSTYSLQEQETGIVFRSGRRQGKFVPPERKIHLRLHAASPDWAAGGLSEAAYDSAARVLQVTVEDSGLPFKVLFRKSS